MLRAWISCSVIPLASPIAALKKSVRETGSMAGVPVMPIGATLPQPAPVFAAFAPMVFCQTTVPRLASSALTWLFSVTAMTMLVPVVPLSKKRTCA